MPIEGRPCYLPDRRHNPEDTSETGIEAYGDTGIEARYERENQFWLAEFLDPEHIERAKQYPLYEEASTEQIVYERLLAISIETGPELPPHTRQRLSNLIGIFRVAIYPNLTPDEQASMQLLANATTVDMKSLQFEINDEARDDMQWIWQKIELETPTDKQVRLLLEKD